MNERELIISAGQGDLDAFNHLVLRYEKPAFHLAYRISGESKLAEDATQIAFIKAYRKLGTFRGGSFKAWLFRIVSNACYDEIRKAARTSSESLDAGDEDDELGANYRWVQDAGESPEDFAERIELSKGIQKCINSLNKDFRLAIVLVDIQGMDYGEAAEAMGSVVGTVRSRLARARKQVRECLQSVGELLPAQYRLNNEAP